MGSPYTGRELYYAALKGHLGCVQYLVGFLPKQTPEHRAFYNCLSATLKGGVASCLLPYLSAEYFNETSIDVVKLGTTEILQAALDKGAQPYSLEKFKLLAEKTEVGYPDFHNVLRDFAVRRERDFVQLLLPKCSEEMVSAAFECVVARGLFAHSDVLLGVLEDLIVAGAEISGFERRANAICIPTVQAVKVAKLIAPHLHPAHIGIRVDLPQFVRKASPEAIKLLFDSFLPGVERDPNV
ncbi:hypothetical protein HK097_008478 [Rhizophlyctis rosea]|uniref:Ankyrin repeat protein n=1 Tax=Rhizophlyctis rosea TaxID=64517 RepID=A0AAD5X8F8_9FUNG|nr:hypothetical protein HK097_008478 [Rhizophlyctis rosea]